MPPLLCAPSLALRLERAEGFANARFVEARARIFPALGACWTEIAGTLAMYDGPQSPCTQTFALGLPHTPSPEDLDRIESFFRERQAPVLHEVSPMADLALIPLLTGRGYRPIEFTSVMYLPLEPRIPAAGDVRVRIAAPEEHALWARIAAEGWRDHVHLGDMLLDLMQVVSSREQAVDFLAELDGEPVAAASLAIHEGVALLAGASTIPRFRRRGAQRALMEARLAHAADAGCDLAMISAAPPGAESQRNAERQRFRLAYTRIKWSLTP